ncbi:DinB family protein [Streptomyces parvulus]|uniref:mycothiol transferase n=1 Tax=Streptomyces parvulus TaxID=146923 RepID=UPI0036C202EE
MHAKDILIEAYGRIREEVHAAVNGLDTEGLNARPADDANSVSWLLWHLTRVQDDHVADAFGLDQVWRAGGWAERFGLGLPVHDTGFGHGPGEVAKVRVDSADLLTGYYDAVHGQTLGALRSLAAKDLERVVDDSWDPPVTLGARLVSVLSDDLQHAGQAAYVRGLVQSAAA